MHLQHNKQYSAIYLLTLLLLLSLVTAACNASWLQVNNPLPTLTVEPGWRVVMQTSGDTTNQSQGKSQNFSLNHVSAHTILRLSIACVGNGSATAKTKVPSIAVAMATSMGTPQTVTTDLVVDTPQTQLTINVRISGSVKWELLVQKIARAT